MTAAVFGGTVVTPDGLLDGGLVTWSAGVISEVAPHTGQPGPAGALDATGCWVVPGFVDIHCHGGGGRSFSSAEDRDIAGAVATHLAHGTTTQLASLVSAPIPELTRQIKNLADLVTDGLIAGIHLEGPFLATARCGAHDPAILRAPDRESVRTLLDAGRGAVRMLTLAPELDGAIEAVETLAASGVIAAIGHTDAVESQVRAAVDAGATVATHLFNGMRPLHHREPGPVGALLADERVSVELICDLIHLHPTVVSLAARHAGPARAVLVTDAIAAAGVGDGSYDIGGRQVTVAGGVPRLAADGTLAGSSLTMDAAFRNLVGCGLPVPAAVAASATRPAALLGLAEITGAIRPGLAADLVVLDADLRVRQVIRRGELQPAA